MVLSKQFSCFHNAQVSPTKVDFSQLDDDDLEDIENLSPKQAELWMQKIDILRAKIKEKATSAGSKQVHHEEEEKDPGANPNIEESLLQKDLTSNPSIEIGQRKENEYTKQPSTKEAIVSGTIPLESARAEADQVLEAAIDKGKEIQLDSGKGNQQEVPNT
ncbi:hypothetical protein RIF29_03587 [Crotalaria pallida]|uniref:Uncharacterized protein n=1 Tax=Crotalaria pallida TaxID=3830 RepID=A0AAN9J041_CROPI